MFETEVILDEDQRGTAARSELYRVLSGLFRYPDDAGPARLANLVQLLRDKLSQLPGAPAATRGLAPLLDELEGLAAGRDLPPLQPTYTALFDNCRGRSAVSLYEKDYGNGDAKAVWEEAIRFYEHFGLDFDVGQSHDWPDHIGTELEFMHYLCYLEATAPADQRMTYVRGQGDFLSRRLSRWSGRFAEQVGGLSGNAPYGLFARLIEAFIDADMAHLGRPREQVGHWVPMQAGNGTVGRTIIPIVDPAARTAATWEMEEPFR